MNQPKSYYIESYGCAMNYSDSELVASILNEKKYYQNKNIETSDIILINTCSIRENAELKIRKRLTDLKKLKINNKKLVIGILGCMAERIKEKLLEEEKLVDLIAGPDAYRSLPDLIEGFSQTHEKAFNVQLSTEETYGDINPVRLNSNGVSAWVTITRGCDNMCSFCVVPFTRGRERSRNPESILNEVSELKMNNFKEITLLGQNVDSYLWYGGGPKKNYKNLNSEEKNSSVNFAQLLEKIAINFPTIRIRFTTSNPQDFNDDVINVIKKYENICNFIHLPFQSGSNRILELMNRGYTLETYLDRIKKIKEEIPNCGLSTDIITGFCTETEEDHKNTLELMEKVHFDYAYMFKYSERSNTFAAKKYKDDIPEIIKSKRLNEIIDLQKTHSHRNNLNDIGKIFKVLVDGESKKSKNQLSGRNDQNKTVIFDKNGYINKGDFVNVFVENCTTATLIGKII